MATKKKVPIVPPTPPAIPAPEFVCSRCGLRKRGAKSGRGMGLPSKWKAFAEQVFCKSCFDASYRLKALTIPVMGILEGGDETAFQAALHEAFQHSTALANWGHRHMLLADFVRCPAMHSIPPMPRIDLYKAYNNAGHPVGKMASQTQAAILRSTLQAYEEQRGACLWARRCSVPAPKYPFPFPVQNQGWSAAWADYTSQHKPTTKDSPTGKERHAGAKRRVPCVGLRIHAEGDGPRWKLRLACGPKFVRHMRDFAAVASGSAKRGELQLLVQRCGKSERNGLWAHFRYRSNGERVPCRVMVKMVAYFPRLDQPAATNVLRLRTDPDSLLTATMDGREIRPWNLNMEHLRGPFCQLHRLSRGRNPDYPPGEIGSIKWWIERHAVWLDRMAEDSKHEKRLPRRIRMATLDAYRRRCDKQSDRVLTWIAQAVAQVVGYCRRRGVGFVHYDDSDRTFVESFPWFALRQRLAQQLGAAGIAFCPNPEGPDGSQEEE